MEEKDDPIYSAFETLRKSILSNLKILKFFLFFVSVIAFAVIVNAFIFAPDKLALGSICSFLSVYLFGFLNYRTKVGVHDIHVETYRKGPPPPRATVLKMIQENANFKPLKLKI